MKDSQGNEIPTTGYYRDPGNGQEYNNGARIGDADIGVKTVKPGQVLLGSNGMQFTVIDVTDKGVRVSRPRGNSFMSDTVVTGNLPAGTYQIPGLNQAVNVTNKGEIVASGAPQNLGGSPGLYKAIDPYTGLPIPGKALNESGTLVDISQDSSAGDPVGWANVALRQLEMARDDYKTQVATAQIPHSEAVDRFKAVADQILAEQNQAQNAISAAHYQNADTNAYDDTRRLIWQQQQQDELQRQQDAVARQQNIANEVGRRQQTFAQEILPSASQAPSMNIPLLGNWKGTPVNIPDFFNAGGLSQIPGIPSASAFAPPTPTAPMAIPLPPPIDPNRYPEIPNSVIPQFPFG